ncbi:MAG: carboxypeptidase regulatory-like domain-containing protein [Flavobacteriales bacterium]|nr:carboxypeptidase regulatory-like domain-containing protein [Flavobacteriales bacterium]
MNTLKYILLTVIGVLSIGAAAQNYSVNGVVIDSKGNPVVGATVCTNKSKVGVMTTDGGVFTLRATPRDKKLRLVMNRATVMEKELSETIAKNPIAFELDEQTDPVIVGYWVGDTYYPGTSDKSLEEIINKVLPNYDFSNGNISGGNKKYAIRVNNSYYSSGAYIAPNNIHSVKVSHNDDTYHTNGVIYITTNDYKQTTTATEVFTLSRDTIRGRVTDGWGRPAPDLKITTPSGETTVTNDSGYYAIRVTSKDKFLRCIMPYTEGTTVRISKENWKKPINLTVMLHRNTLRGWKNPDDPNMYHPGDNETWYSIISMFPGTQYANRRVFFSRYQKHKIQDFEESAFIGKNKEAHPTSGNQARLVLDGVPLGIPLDAVEPSSVHSVKIIRDNAVPIYGPAAQFGAVEIVTKGMKMAPVPLTDFAAKKAQRKGGLEGMKEYIALQGKNIEYHEDGYIMIDGKRCCLYIINDQKFTHMRGIEVGMIDEIMIVRSGVEGSYGPRAKNGVVLISASQKEKKMVDEKGNTVSEKEYKKQQRNKKK